MSFIALKIHMSANTAEHLEHNDAFILTLRKEAVFIKVCVIIFVIRLPFHTGSKGLVTDMGRYISKSA